MGFRKTCELTNRSGSNVGYNNVPRRIRYATLKYITSPVTSTIVATNGADETAGSKPIPRKINGNTEPLNAPHMTTPTSEIATVSATSSQCSPYRSPNQDHRAMRKNP